MARKKRRSTQFKDTSKVIDMEQARAERQEKRAKKRHTNRSGRRSQSMAGERTTGSFEELFPEEAERMRRELAGGPGMNGAPDVAGAPDMAGAPEEDDFQGFVTDRGEEPEDAGASGAPEEDDFQGFVTDRDEPEGAADEAAGGPAGEPAEGAAEEAEGDAAGGSGDSPGAEPAEGAAEEAEGDAAGGSGAEPAEGAAEEPAAEDGAASGEGRERPVTPLPPNISARQNNRRRIMRRRKQIYRLAIVAFCIFFLAIFSVSVGRIIMLKHDLHSAQKQQEEYQEEKEQLEKELAENNDLDTLEEQARDQMRLIKPGETLYLFPDEMADEEDEDEEK